MKPALLLTVDVEEFVIPEQAGIPFSREEAFRLGRQGLERLLGVMEEHGVSGTFFSTLAFARRFPDLLGRLPEGGHELGLHAVEHVHDYRSMPPAKAERLLGDARREMRETFRVPMDGYRANRFRAPPRSVLRRLGFRWTSNVHPTWVPGRYNHLRRPRVVHLDEGLLEIPISVTPVLRLPVSWFWMRNLGLAYLKAASRRAWRGTGYLHLYVHPWELADLPRLRGLSPVSRLSVRRTGAPFVRLLERFLSWCRRLGLRPSTITRHLQDAGHLGSISGSA